MKKRKTRKVYHVTSTPDNGWKVKKEGASRASGHFEKKTEAVKKGKELAKSSPKGQIIIHKKDGRFQTEHTYKDDPYPPKG